MSLLLYIAVFLSSFAVDCVPFFAPPAWTLMMVFMVQFDLSPWLTALFGSFGTTCGRTLFMTFIVPWIGHKAIGRKTNDDMKFVGKKLSGKGPAVAIFVFLYALSPLSSTALFTAVGLARVPRTLIIVPFFLGHLIGDGVLLISGHYAIDSFSDILEGSMQPKSLAFMFAGLFIVFAMLFVDWRTLLEHRKLEFNWKFWK